MYCICIYCHIINANIFIAYQIFSPYLAALAAILHNSHYLLKKSEFLRKDNNKKPGLLDLNPLNFSTIVELQLGTEMELIGVSISCIDTT